MQCITMYCTTLHCTDVQFSALPFNAMYFTASQKSLCSGLMRCNYSYAAKIIMTIFLQYIWWQCVNEYDSATISSASKCNAKQSHILSFWVVSHFEFLSFVTYWVFEFCHILSFGFFVTFWILSFYTFEFCSFVTFSVFLVLVTFWVL